MIEAVRTLGAPVSQSGSDLSITGVAGRWRVPPEGATLFLNNAGTATRFLTAAAMLADAPITIDGNERMRQRPIGELAVALRALGGEVAYLGAHGCPPVRVSRPPNAPTEIVEFGSTRSSQFLSAILLVAPWLPGGVTMRLTASPTSASYVRMTLDLLARVGASVRASADMRVIRVLPDPAQSGGLGAFDLAIEPDASGATYWWAAAAMHPNLTCLVPELTPESAQGDVSFVSMMARCGAEPVVIEDDACPAIGVRGANALHGLLADMSDMPDAAVTLAVVCAFADGASVIRGVRTLRDKECDRIAALKTELGKIGVRIDDDATGDPDAMTITPPPGGVDCSAGAPPIVFDTYDDHRMAMALSLVGLRRPNVSIADPGCVAKTYAGFWKDFDRLCTPLAPISDAAPEH